MGGDGGRTVARGSARFEYADISGWNENGWVTPLPLHRACGRVGEQAEESSVVLPLSFTPCGRRILSVSRPLTRLLRVAHSSAVACRHGFGAPRVHNSCCACPASAASLLHTVHRAAADVGHRHFPRASRPGRGGALCAARSNPPGSFHCRPLHSRLLPAVKHHCLCSSCAGRSAQLSAEPRTYPCIDDSCSQRGSDATSALASPTLFQHSPLLTSTPPCGIIADRGRNRDGNIRLKPRGFGMKTLSLSTAHNPYFSLKFGVYGCTASVLQCCQLRVTSRNTR